MNGKSVIVGLVTLSLTAALAAATMLSVIFGLESKYISAADTILVRIHLHFWPVLWLALLAFIAGFVWDLRRARHVRK